MLQVVTTMFDFPMVYSVDTGQAVSSMKQMDTMIAGALCVRISPDDTLVAVASSDGTVRVMNMSTNKYK